ncbi:hypothetical protein [Frankia sp. AgB32]|uniref:hypothetical protein n=1 Tax=Frankia sp. AgB32 TaxID=631119 RepID=UPI00200ED339|nr:hypothetical protein [Frankia sp. AgB32]MCK9894489.1 hypothetical protein [Frankia sp. AgB32]
MEVSNHEHHVLNQGNAGLPSILQRQRFHANMLREDISRLLGQEIPPKFSAPTREYLLELYRGLSSKNGATRCAWMISFEAHAERMIAALWASVARVFDCSPEELRYFSAHVGGADPAEKYHVETTASMFDKIVTSDLSGFSETLLASYRRHVTWCAALLS